MSDTPRTDALAETHDECAEWVERSAGYNSLLDFARQLERELAQSNVLYAQVIEGQRQLQRESDELIRAALGVTRWDWSNNDPDCVLDIDKLRMVAERAIGKTCSAGSSDKATRK